MKKVMIGAIALTIALAPVMSFAKGKHSKKAEPAKTEMKADAPAKAAPAKAAPAKAAPAKAVPAKAAPAKK